MQESYSEGGEKKQQTQFRVKNHDTATDESDWVRVSSA